MQTCAKVLEFYICSDTSERSCGYSWSFFHTDHWEDTGGYSLNRPNRIVGLFWSCYSVLGHGYSSGSKLTSFSVLCIHCFQGLSQGANAVPLCPTDLHFPPSLEGSLALLSRTLFAGLSFRKTEPQKEALSGHLVLFALWHQSQSPNEERCQNPQKFSWLLCWWDHPWNNLHGQADVSHSAGLYTSYQLWGKRDGISLTDLGIRIHCWSLEVSPPKVNSYYIVKLGRES